MDNIVSTFEIMVNSYTNADELMNFAATMGIQESPSVRFRLFQLRHREYDNDFVNGELDSILQNLGGELNTAEDFNEEDLELAVDYIRDQNEIDESMKAILFDDQMDELATACLDDGDWDPPTPVIQSGSGQPGPSHKLRYTMRKKSERTYAKNAAVDRTYQVKVDERYHGQELRDVREGLHNMFQDVLNEARGDLAGNDLGRVVIHHQGLHDPIVVPLRDWDHLNADGVMAMIEKVLNSNKDLSIEKVSTLLLVPLIYRKEEPGVE